MSLIAHGVDLVDIEGFRAQMEEERTGILERCFSTSEIEVAGEPGSEHRLAGWFAAKESIMKALGLGFSNDLAFTEVEILHSEVGAPQIRLTGKCLERANLLGIRNWLVSISHTDSHAIASVIGLGRPQTY